LSEALTLRTTSSAKRSTDFSWSEKTGD